MKPITVIGSAAFLGVMLAIGFGLIPLFYLADRSAFEDWFADYFVFFLPAVGLWTVAHTLRIAGTGFAAHSAFQASQLPKGQPV